MVSDEARPCVLPLGVGASVTEMWQLALSHPLLARRTVGFQRVQDSRAAWPGHTDHAPDTIHLNQHTCTQSTRSLHAVYTQSTRSLHAVCTQSTQIYTNLHKSTSLGGSQSRLRGVAGLIQRVWLVSPHPLRLLPLYPFSIYTGIGARRRGVGSYGLGTPTPSLVRLRKALGL